MNSLLLVLAGGILSSPHWGLALSASVLVVGVLVAKAIESRNKARSEEGDGS